MIRYWSSEADLDPRRPAWLREPTASAVVWADVAEPTADDGQVLREVFGLHELAVEDALERETHPKVETYGEVLYVVLHGINFQADRARLRHPRHRLLPGRALPGHRPRRQAAQHRPRQRAVRAQRPLILAEGPVALMHRIVDTMVDHYRPEVDELEEWLDEIEQQVIETAGEALTSEILAVKRDISALRRIVVPQRDVVGRLARREFD